MLKNSDITSLKEMIKNSHHIVFLTGAGMSKASGIPDIRGVDGLLKRDMNNIKYGATYEEIVSHSYFMNSPSGFYKYYFNEMIFKDAKPNEGHKLIASLNDKATVITQNIDGLHSLAGSKNVIEIHGSVAHNHCLKCNEHYSLNEIIKLGDVPTCPKCGGIIKPDVVLFEEPLDEASLTNAVTAIEEADLLIVIGSSLVVNPAASLPYYFRGLNFVIINKEETPLDRMAKLVIHDDCISVLKSVIE